MEARKTIAEVPEAQLFGLLSDALLDAPAIVEELPGCAPLDIEEIVTDFMPPDHKIVLTYVGESETSPVLYYIKTDTHDPNPFQMPSGKLTAGETFNVSRICHSENGLTFGIGYHGQGHNYFYANSLNDLSIKVVEKTESEKAQDKLQEVNGDIGQYDYYSLMAQKYQESTDRLLNAIENLLPAFGTDSPCRYSIDSSLGGALYRLNESEVPEFIAEWTAFEGNVLTGKFLGNRLAVIDGKLLLIDDETRLAMGTIIVERRQRAFGFSYLEVVDTNSPDLYGERDNSALQQKITSR